MLGQLVSALASFVGTVAVIAAVCLIRVREPRARRNQAAKRAETERLAKLRADLAPEDRQWLREHGADWIDECIPHGVPQKPAVRVVVHEGPDGTLTYSQADTSGRTAGDERENAVRRLQRSSIGCTPARAESFVDVLGIDRIRAASDQDLRREVAAIQAATEYRLMRIQAIARAGWPSDVA